MWQAWNTPLSLPVIKPELIDFALTIGQREVGKPVKSFFRISSTFTSNKQRAHCKSIVGILEKEALHWRTKHKDCQWHGTWMHRVPCVSSVAGGEFWSKRRKSEHRATLQISENLNISLCYVTDQFMASQRSALLPGSPLVTFLPTCCSLTLIFIRLLHTNCHLYVHIPWTL
jgi:hypothetical protein